MEKENTRLKKDSQGVSALVSISVYSLSFLVLSFILSSIVYALFLPEGIVDVSSLNVAQLILIQLTLLLSGLIPAIVILRYLDCRPFSDLGFDVKGYGRELLYGMLMAIVIYGGGFVISVTSDFVSVVGVQFDGGWLLGSFFYYLLVAVTEELIFRGYILGRLLRTRMDEYLAVLISSLMFTGLHLMNPNIGFLPIINIFLAGLLFGFIYLNRRNLWFLISLHLFWNWLQGPILGYEVSGNKLGESLLKLHLLDDSPLTGGAFGFEGSIICTILTVVVIAGVIKGSK